MKFPEACVAESTRASFVSDAPDVSPRSPNRGVLVIALASCALITSCGPKTPRTGAGDEPSLRWTASATSTISAHVAAVALTETGEVVIGGEFAGTLALGDSRATSAGGIDGFVALLGGDGELRWIRRVGGNGDDRIRSVAVGPAGQIAFGGELSSRLSIDGHDVVAAGAPDGLVGVMSSSGEVSWMTAIGGTRYASVADVEFMRGGDVAVVGYFAGLLGLLDRPIYSAGNVDVFAGRFRAVGGPVWVVRGGGPGADLARQVASKGDGIVLSGSVMDRAQFGPFSIDIDGPTSNLLVAELDRDGRFQGASSSGGQNNDSGAAITVAGGKVVAGGRSVPALVSVGAGGALVSATALPDIVTVTALAHDGQLFAARVVANPSGVGSGAAITSGLLSGKTRTANLASNASLAVMSLAAKNKSVLVGGSFRGELTIGRQRTKSNEAAGFVALWDWNSN